MRPLSLAARGGPVLVLVCAWTWVTAASTLLPDDLAPEARVVHALVVLVAAPALAVFLPWSRQPSADAVPAAVRWTVCLAASMTWLLLLGVGLLLAGAWDGDTVLVVTALVVSAALLTGRLPVRPNVPDDRG